MAIHTWYTLLRHNKNQKVWRDRQLVMKIRLFNCYIVMKITGLHCYLRALIELVSIGWSWSQSDYSHKFKCSIKCQLFSNGHYSFIHPIMLWKDCRKTIIKATSAYNTYNTSCISAINHCITFGNRVIFETKTKHSLTHCVLYLLSFILRVWSKSAKMI